MATASSSELTVAEDGDADGQEARNDEQQNESALNEPGALQFMADLSAATGDGNHLPVRRLNLRQYQVSFDRRQYTARQVIAQLLEKFEVEDLELHEPELSDIVRAIYEGEFQV